MCPLRLLEEAEVVTPGQKEEDRRPVQRAKHVR